MSNEYFALAQQVGQELGVPPEIIYAQWQHETGNFTSDVFREYGNPAGIKNYPAMNDYQKYNSPNDFANAYVRLLKQYEGVPGAKNVEQFAGALKNGGYYEDSYNNYANGMKRFLGEGQIAGNSAVPASVVSSGTGVTNPTTNKTTYVPVPMLPQKSYQDILPEGFVEKAMGMQMGNPKRAAQQALERNIPALMQAYSGSNSQAAIQQMLPIMQLLSQGDVSVAETDIAMQNDLAKRQAISQMLSYLPRMQNPQEQAALMAAIETMGGKAPSYDTLKYSYETPDQASSTLAALATGNANRDVEWQKAIMEKDYKDKHLKLIEQEIGIKLMDAVKKSSAGTFGHEDLNGIIKAKDSLFTAQQMTGDDETFLKRFKTEIAMIARLEAGGRNLTPDELAQFITDNFKIPLRQKTSSSQSSVPPEKTNTSTASSGYTYPGYVPRGITVPSQPSGAIPYQVVIDPTLVNPPGIAQSPTTRMR